MKTGAGASSQSWHRCVELMAQRFAWRSALLCHMTLLVQDHSRAAGKQPHSEQFSAGCCSVPKLPDPCPYPRHSGNGKGAWPGTQCPSSLCPQLSTFLLTGRGLALPTINLMPSSGATLTTNSSVLPLQEDIFHCHPNFVFP